MTTRAEERIRELEQLVLELEGEVRALSRDCLLAYRERERARDLACRLQGEYEQLVGSWGSSPFARDCADREIDEYGITISRGPAG